MSTNKYKWLTLGLASIVISGCAVGSKPHLNLGIADAFRKSKNNLLKKRLSYRTPATGATFGYAAPVNDGVHIEDGSIVMMSDQSASVVPSDCGCNTGASVPASEFYLPTGATLTPADSDSGNFLPEAASPIENLQDDFELVNPLPAAADATDTSTASGFSVDSPDEEGGIETLDSASVGLDEADDNLEMTPKKDGTSILDTAAKPLESQTPTSAGHSVVEQRPQMLTLTARPAQSHQVATPLFEQTKIDMQQVAHKRHFRQQNSLRPLHQKFRSEPLEHTAEAPRPVKFKPLPVMSKESEKKATSDSTTGAPVLNRTRSSKTRDQSNSKLQRLPEPVQKLEPKTEKNSVIKIARLPILKAESTSSAAIGSLRNFTNVRDPNPGSDKGRYLRKHAEATTLKAVQVSEDEPSGSSDGLSTDY